MKFVLKQLIVQALTWEAKLVLQKYKPKIVAITGSVGKTTTKDAIYYALTASFHVRRSEKSFNSEIGIPLTILGCQNGWYNPFLWVRNLLRGLMLIALPAKYPEWLVLEVGADRPGDIQSVSSWIHADVVVFTNFAKVPVHVEFFENAEAVLTEKSFLIRGMKDNGHLVLNADSKEVLGLKELRRSGRFTSYTAEGNDAHLSVSNMNVMYEERAGHQVPKGITFKVDYGNNSIPVSVSGVLGKQHVYPILAAISVGLGEGINPVAISEALASYCPPRGRMNIIEGIKKTTLIDDSYNSSPIAVEEALSTLKQVTATGRKIAILGDMMELGKHSAEAHQAIGRLLAGGVQILATVGVRAREIAEVALQNGMSEKNVFQFEEAQKAGAFMQNLLQEGDIILIKGSQSTRCEKVVEELMAHPEQAEKLLVRQEKEWKRK